VDVGAETTGLVIYQRGAVQHTAVFPLGGSHFTNDIAFGLRTPIPDAEKIKRTVGCACSTSLTEMQRSELVDVPRWAAGPHVNFLGKSFAIFCSRAQKKF